VADSRGAYHSLAEEKPLAWTAPEALRFSEPSVYTAHSDVWSFGVLCWVTLLTGSDISQEIWTDAAEPRYSEFRSADLWYEVIKNGGRLARPEGCPEEVYSLLQQCWTWQPTSRPSAANLLQQLRALFPSSAVVVAQVQGFSDQDQYSQKST
jgi:serine/threonine protein kinase